MNPHLLESHIWFNKDNGFYEVADFRNIIIKRRIAKIRQSSVDKFLMRLNFYTALVSVEHIGEFTRIEYISFIPAKVKFDDKDEAMAFLKFNFADINTAQVDLERKLCEDF